MIDTSWDERLIRAVIFAKNSSAGRPHKLMNVIVGISIAIIYSCMIKDMVVPAKINSGAGLLQRCPESVAFFRIRPQAICVYKLEGRLVCINENMRQCVPGNNLIQPFLIYTMRTVGIDIRRPRSK